MARCIVFRESFFFALYTPSCECRHGFEAQINRVRRDKLQEGQVFGRSLDNGMDLLAPDRLSDSWSLELIHGKAELVIPNGSNTLTSLAMCSCCSGSFAGQVPKYPWIGQASHTQVRCAWRISTALHTGYIRWLREFLSKNLIRCKWSVPHLSPSTPRQLWSIPGPRRTMTWCPCPGPFLQVICVAGRDFFGR